MRISDLNIYRINLLHNSCAKLQFCCAKFVYLHNANLDAYGTDCNLCQDNENGRGNQVAVPLDRRSQS